MKHCGVRGKRFSFKGDTHILLLTRDEDDTYHFFHLRNGNVQRRVNFGQNPVSAQIDYEQEVSLFQEMMNCENS